MNKKTIFFSLGLALAISFLFFNSSFAAPPTGGLWGQYAKVADSTKLWITEFTHLEVENLDFENFDQVLKNRTGFSKNSRVFWRGGIYAPESGSYNFRFDVVSDLIASFSIDGKKHINSKIGDQIVMGVYLEKGWHTISILFAARGDDSMMKFYWTVPGEKEEIVPEDKLTYKFWSDSVLTIPSDGSKESLDYVTAGVGSRDMPNPEIEIDMPADLNDILREDVWIVWFKEDGENNNIRVKNEKNGSDATITGKIITSPMGTEVDYPEVYGKLPKSLVDDDGSGKLHFSFRKVSASDPNFANGISIIVPFKDSTKPEGKLSIRMVGATAYLGASPILTFPVKGGETIDPLFMFADGETKTKIEESTSGYRPNYMVMLSGEGTPPGEVGNLIKKSGTKLLVPQQNLISKSNPKTWYPCYGREGTQFDVISSKYVPNQWSSVSSQYIGTNEGRIDPITIPDTHTWVAFQYFGSNFDEDGKIGSGESGSITGGGMFSEKILDPDEFDLKVTVSGNGTVKSINIPGINCIGPSSSGDCEKSYPDGQIVVLEEDAGTQYEFSGWSGSGTSCDGTTANLCNLTVSADTPINAAFGYVPGGVCSSANGATSCAEPIKKCVLGTAVDENYDVATKTWTWKCVKDGFYSGVCSASKSCDIQEVIP